MDESDVRLRLTFQCLFGLLAFAVLLVAHTVGVFLDIAGSRPGLTLAMAGVALTVLAQSEVIIVGSTSVDRRRHQLLGVAFWWGGLLCAAFSLLILVLAGGR